MEFNSFVSKLFHRYPESQKLDSPLNDPFYYDEFGTIKGYEKLQETAKEVVNKIIHKQVLLTAIHSKKSDLTEDQRRIRELEKHLLEVELQMAKNEYFSIGQHIQIAKTIVGINKILTPVVFSIPNKKEAKRILELAQKYMPLLTSIDKNLNRFADESNEKREESK